MEISHNTDYSLWGGRFELPSDELMKKFNESFSVDKRLWKQDIVGSAAWARSIEKIGILTKSELDLTLKGLEKISEEWKSGTFAEHENDEDIHTANERRLKELIGDVAMKLHTGRSRNDQVVTDMRLWLKESLDKLAAVLKILITSLVNRSESEIDVILPGYTHLQRAQPIRWSHLLLSYVCPLDRDMDRLRQLKQRVDVCPLGSGAIAGNPFSIDREALANDLEFSYCTLNSIDSTANRDFISEFLFLNTSISLTLSKLAEDFIIYSSKEFSFIQLSDSYCTGSSLMPQKKNCDSLELIRGKSGKLLGLLCGFLMTVKAIPTSYNKDLQEDKTAMFNSFDIIYGILKITTGVINTLLVKRENMLNALSSDLLATDLAYYLVRKGIPFRVAHSIAGQCVSLCEKKACNLKDLSLDQLKTVSAFFGKDVIDVYDFEKSVEQYSSIGGTAKSSVIHQIMQFRDKYN